MGLKKCGMCGFENCTEKEKNENVPCAFNTGDLGIAIGSAVSVAADNRADNRVILEWGSAVSWNRSLKVDLRHATFPLQV